MSEEYLTKELGKEEFLESALANNPKANIKLISQAYDLSKSAHRGQKRLSEEEQFLHAQETANMLARMGLDSQTVCAALLHDVLEDTKVKSSYIKEIFGEEILSLVEGVTKIEDINLSLEEKRAENLRKVILATIKDTRVIMIKLADRLHNMRTLKYLDRQTQIETAKETLDIYVPIAYKLGMYRMKTELEDLCLRYLEPEVYQELKSRIAKKKETREREVKEIIKNIKRLLLSKGIKAEVQGRAKGFYSIYKKMIRKGINFNDIRDLSAIRVIADTTDDCYRILGILHSNQVPLPGGFHDYIAMPKPNMYQSVHTDILYAGKPIEVQIRTMNMHHLAEEGVAAHWRYKDTERDKKFDKRIAWLKQILEWRLSLNSKEFIENLKIDLFKDEIFVLTPKGDPIALPERATPIDFAYAVHTDIGNHCVRAKVNNNIAPLDYELESGDVVEIVTSKNVAPSRHWLNFVVTNLAKGKIRQALGIAADSEAKKRKEAVSENILDKIEAEGIKKSALKLSKCCIPKENDEIIGYRMKDGKIAIHKADCINLSELDNHRKIKLDWGSKPKQLIKLRVVVIDRVGLFADILNIFSSMNINVESLNTKMAKERFFILFEFKPLDNSMLAELISKIKQTRNVVEVQLV